MYPHTLTQPGYLLLSLDLRPRLPLHDISSLAALQLPFPVCLDFSPPFVLSLVFLLLLVLEGKSGV